MQRGGAVCVTSMLCISPHRVTEQAGAEEDGLPMLWCTPFVMGPLMSAKAGHPC